MKHIFLAVSVLCFHSFSQADELSISLKTLATAPVAGDAQGVAAAWKIVAAAPISKMPRILDAMPSDNPVGQNWIRNAVESQLESANKAGRLPDKSAFADYATDRSNPPLARGIAFEWFEKLDPKAAKVLLAQFTDDPNLELRYQAVATLIAAADASSEEGLKKDLLKRAFASSRDIDQLSECASKLDEFGIEVSVVEQLGYVTTWKVVGPFDNRGGHGFSKVFPPEKKIDTSLVYEGKSGPVKWGQLSTDASLGKLDLAEHFDNEKGAVAYVAATANAQKEVVASIRYNSHSATKLWLNGELIAENEIYHAGGDGDQYIVPVKLEKGPNVILMKTCQNEQTEPWAQQWDFGLRVCDPLGGRIDGLSFGTPE